MGVILDFYKKNNSNGDIVKKAEEYLLIDTLSKSLKGDSKIKEIDGMDMESKLCGKIIPSMIYTFAYNFDKDMQMEDNFIFGDKMPIVLCCELKSFLKMINNKPTKCLNMVGINLNFLKNEDRAIVLDAIYNSFSSFYDNIYKDVYNNKAAINNALLSLVSKNNFVDTIKSITNIDVSKCVRSYSISLCKDIRLIEYNLWKYIPIYESKRTVSNLSINKIQEIMSIK